MKKQLFFLVLLLCMAGMTMQAQQRKVLFEEFTSSTCAPCATMNTWLNPLLENNAEKVVVIKYQMNWPGAGDPYYTAEGGARLQFYPPQQPPYYVVPAPYVNGVYTSSQSAIQNGINNGYAQPAEAIITGTFSVSGNIITINGNVTPLISGSGYRIYVVVNEKTTYDNKMSNGETEFHHVMMKMFPNGNGTTVTLTSGTAIPFSYTYDMSTTHVEEMDDLEVAVFVQNASTRAVLNAAYLEDITLPAPQNMKATQTQIDHLNVNITWSPPSGASPNGYNVYRDNVKLNTSLITTTSYQDVAPEYGKIYTYAIGAVSNGDEGYWATDTVLTNVNIHVPIITTAKQTRGLQMLVEWDMPQTVFPVKYKVYRSGISQTPNPISETSIINTGLSYREYCFEIEPVVNTIIGARSSSVCITLLNIPQPTNLKAEQVSISSKEVLLTWEGSSSNTAGYNIYRDNIQINTELITTKTYSDLVSEYGVQYTYQVYGVANTGAESEKCGEVKITLFNTVPPPTNVQATQQNNELTVVVTWNAVTLVDIMGYNIYRDGKKLNTTLVAETEYLDNVPDKGIYCYTVTSITEVEESVPSESACLEVIVGICDIEKGVFTIYPNPVSGMLYINTEETITNCQIFNIQGQIVYSTSSSIKEVATENWSPGVYIIRITTEKGTAEKRFKKF